MLRDEYLNALRDAAHVRLYLSANDGARLWWPWRIHPPSEATERYRATCEHYVIDSDPLDDDVTTRDVLDRACEVDADVASLQDVYQDKAATVDSLLTGLEVADDHRFGGTLLLPLQAPYVACWRELGEPTEEWLGIGGLKDAPAHDRLAAARSLRDAVGADVWMHGFGWGVDGIASDIRRSPGLLDSLDYSTPMQDADMAGSPGDERMSVVAMEAATRLVHDLREVSAHPDRAERTQASALEWMT